MPYPFSFLKRPVASVPAPLHVTSSLFVRRSWNQRWTYQKGFIPRDLGLGHDPSLRAPMPGITAPVVGRDALRFALLSPDRKHRTAPSHPLSHHQVQDCCIAARSSSNNVSVCEETVPLCCRPRAVTVTCRPWQRAQSRRASHFLSSLE